MKLKRVLMMAGGLFAFAAVAMAVDTKTDYDHSVDFSKFHTFAWKAPRSPADGVVRNTLVLTRIKNAVAEALGVKGIRQNVVNPDLYVTVHVAAKNVQDVDYLPPIGGWRIGGWRYWDWMGPDIVVQEYVQGTMILDMVDATSNKLVWRAISTDSGSNLLDVQSEKTVDKMVRESLDHFPPRNESD